MLILGLLLMLLQTAACVERFCSFKQSDCYAALGHKLNLLMVNASIYGLTVKTRINNTDGPVCRVKNDTMSRNECDLFRNRTEVTIINGTVIINPVKRGDSGNYTLLQPGAEGRLTSEDLQLHVEAPVGSVEVSISCSSNQTRSVSCSSTEGDQLLYSWTLNGKSLMDGNTSIHLEKETEGKITCTVRNHVSEVNKTADIKDCPGSTTGGPSLTSPETTTKHGTSLSTSGTVSTSTHLSSTSTLFKLILMITLASVAVVLILLFIIVFCIYRKKEDKPAPAPARDVELVYAQISHEKSNKKSSEKKIESSPAADVEYAGVGPQTKRKKKKKKEEEIQYGEVTFTPKTSNVQQQQKPMEESVYSQVQRC